MQKFFHSLKLLLFAFIWAVSLTEILFNPSVRDWLLGFLTNHPFAAPVILVCVQIIFASFALPCSALTVLAGVLWGVGYGILYSTIATIFSSIWTFLIGRFFLKKLTREKFDHRWYSKIKNLIQKYHWKASMIAHANPIFPGSSLGYIFGLSEVTFGSFITGAFLGTLPLQLVLVGIGHLTIKSLTSEFNFWMIFSLVLLVLIVFLYKKITPAIMSKAID